IIDDLISEIGIFTVHLAGKPITQNKGYAGYLIRSKSTRTTEGGIHSGQGVLDSLALSEL
ncbi:glutathione synthase, partial [Photobacterium damselae subsp. damselae]|nr:glutathione synthase [Photobacterium damselae subsp. damselae]